MYFAQKFAFKRKIHCDFTQRRMRLNARLNAKFCVQSQKFAFNRKSIAFKRKNIFAPLLPLNSIIFANKRNSYCD